jgi:hypothetical protein
MIPARFARGSDEALCWGDGSPPLTVADRDRIEQQEPYAVSLDLGTPKFLRDVIAQRLAVPRERAKLPQGADPLNPLPAHRRSP